MFPFQTIDFELRKMEAQQAAEMVNVLKAFMPNTFLVSGGEVQQLLPTHTHTHTHTHIQSCT